MRDKRSFINISPAIWAMMFLLSSWACSHSGLSISREYQAELAEYLNAVTTNYIELKDALVNSNRSQTAKEAKEFLVYLQEIEDSHLDAEVRQQWIDHKLELINILEQQYGSVGLESQRQMFTGLTSQLEILIDQFGPVEQTLYKQYCPKALDGEGGYWLNEKKEILNPYGGSGQLHCGKIVEVIEGRGELGN